jgi:hypothetical protein
LSVIVDSNETEGVIRQVWEAADDDAAAATASSAAPAMFERPDRGAAAARRL